MITVTTSDLASSASGPARPGHVDSDDSECVIVLVKGSAQECPLLITEGSET